MVGFNLFHLLSVCKTRYGTQQQTVLNLSFFQTSDWDRPQEPGANSHGTTTRSELLLFSHQTNSHWEQRLNDHDSRPSRLHNPLQSSSGKLVMARPIQERVFDVCLIALRSVANSRSSVCRVQHGDVTEKLLLNPTRVMFRTDALIYSV